MSTNLLCTIFPFVDWTWLAWRYFLKLFLVFEFLISISFSILLNPVAPWDSEEEQQDGFFQLLNFGKIQSLKHQQPHLFFNYFLIDLKSTPSTFRTLILGTSACEWIYFCVVPRLAMKSQNQGRWHWLPAECTLLQPPTIQYSEQSDILKHSGKQQRVCTKYNKGFPT